MGLTLADSLAKASRSGSETVKIAPKTKRGGWKTHCHNVLKLKRGKKPGLINAQPERASGK